MSKSNLISIHRHIERREFAEACKQNDMLRAQLRQRDTVLWSLLHRNGPQTLTAEEMGMMPDGAMIQCNPGADANSVVFTAVDPVKPEAEKEPTHEAKASEDR